MIYSYNPFQVQMVAEGIARFVQDEVQTNFLPTKSCDGAKGWKGTI